MVSSISDSQESRSGHATRAEPELTLEVIGCDRCGRRFATDDGPGMIAIIVGPCPDCGGTFRLLDPSEDDETAF